MKSVNFSPVISVTLSSGTLPKLRRNADQSPGLPEQGLLIDERESALYMLLYEFLLPGASEFM